MRILSTPESTCGDARVDIATVIGFILGFVAIVGSIILTKTVGMFIDIKSVMIVLFGTIAALLIARSRRRIDSACSSR